MSSFSASVDAFTVRTRSRALAVTRIAASMVAEDAGRPRSQGGRMRVDTGFLRNSIRGAIGSLPSGPSLGPKKTKAGIVWRDPMGNADEVALVITRWDGRSPIYIGWTANYARYREYKDGFLEGAVRQWPRFVRDAASMIGPP